MARARQPFMRLLPQAIAAAARWGTARPIRPAGGRMSRTTPFPRSGRHAARSLWGEDLRDRLGQAVTQSPVEVLNAFMVDAMARVRSGTGTFECRCDSVLSHRPDSENRWIKAIATDTRLQGEPGVLMDSREDDTRTSGGNILRG
jgi:hypothetical protein